MSGASGTPDGIRLAFIGAGLVNFGGGEGPWDHASRFEQMERVQCVAVADVNLLRAQEVIAARRRGAHPQAWSEAQAFADWREMLDRVRVDAAVIGLPPDVHGLASPPFDVELELARRKIHMLVEKPLSAAPVSVVEEVARGLADSGVVVSVGYMFRYMRAIDRMRQVLQEVDDGPRVFLARYDCAYSTISRTAWWDQRRSGGPIVEQATHFLDLGRYLMGEVDLHDDGGPWTSLCVCCIRASDGNGRLTDLPTGPGGAPIESGIPAEYRSPRVTVAQWRFADGSLGTLTHGVLLHGRQYEAELEVWADGLRCVLADPYGRPRLGVRRSGNDETQWETFDGDDPYMSEDRAFIDAIRGRPCGIRSTYKDALETYRLSVAIREAGK